MSYNTNGTENFDQVNINKIRSSLKEERNGSDEAYTMVQVNSPCEVKVPRKSREICAESLMK